jgi:TRAP-type mannitol/chloroaromatic compound transport system permease large subunit
MEMLKQILMKPLVVLVLIIQCVFLVVTLFSAPKANGQLNAAISTLRTPSQSNLARIDQNDARELRAVLQQLNNNNKSMVTTSLLFSIVSIVLMAAAIFLPLALNRAAATVGADGQLKLQSGNIG